MLLEETSRLAKIKELVGIFYAFAQKKKVFILGAKDAKKKKTSKGDYLNLIHNVITQ